MTKCLTAHMSKLTSDHEYFGVAIGDEDRIVVTVRGKTVHGEPGETVHADFDLVEFGEILRELNGAWTKLHRDGGYFDEVGKKGK